MRGTLSASTWEGSAPPTKNRNERRNVLLIAMTALLISAAFASFAAAVLSEDSDAGLTQCQPYPYYGTPEATMGRIYNYAGSEYTYAIALEKGHTLKWSPYVKDYTNYVDISMEYTGKYWEVTVNGTYSGSSMLFYFYDGTDPSWTVSKPFSLYIDLFRHNYLQFDANGGTGAPKTQEYRMSEWTITGDDPVRDGYRFLGWCLDKNGEGTLYQKGDTVTYKDRTLVDPLYVTIYAVWSDHYTIGFDADGGVCAVSSIEVGIGKTMRLPDATRISKTSNPGGYIEDIYEFEGWYIDDVFVGMPGSSYVPTDDASLIAKWRLKSSVDHRYTVSFDPNGGTCSVRTASGICDLPNATRSDSIEVNDISRITVSYRFAGWSASPVGGISAGASGDNYTPESDITLYAQWTPIESKVYLFALEFDPNGGSGTFTTMTAESDSDRLEMILPSSKPSLRGHSFIGWDVDGYILSPGSRYEAKAGTTVLTASWNQLDAPLEGSPATTCRDGDRWTFSPTVSDGSTLKVSGASWISISGGILEGIPPGKGTYRFTLTVSNEGYRDSSMDITIEVVSKLSFLSSPTGGAIAYEL